MGARPAHRTSAAADGAAADGADGGATAQQPPAQQPPPAGPVGTILLLPLDDATGPTGEVEIGWHLHPDYQGRGLATEAARALLSAAARAGRERVLALTDPDNAASQRGGRPAGLADEGLTDRWFGLTTRQFAWTAPRSAGQQEQLA